MLSSLIQKYRSMRRHAYLKRLTDYRHAYAFIGAGQHSIANLYPCLHQLNIPLRYICTRTPDHATQLAGSFPSCTGVSDLDVILKDETVRGVFVCTQPDQHPGLLKQLFQAGKAVFVEKPPAPSLQTLDDLIALQGALTCTVGLQRRHSTIHHLLERQDFSTATYHYRYLTGAYPEGDPLTELFIHPLDYAIQLFGPTAAHSLQPIVSGPLLTWFIHLRHSRGAAGTLELSTCYSWSQIRETLEINTAKETWVARYPFHLTAMEKPARIAGIPAEKLLSRPGIQKIYLDNQGTLPVDTQNSLTSQGFFGEIEQFINSVEKNTATSGLASLRNTYEILDQMRRHPLPD